MKRAPLTLTALAAFGLAGAAAAQDCPVPASDPFALDDAQIVDIYDCMKDAMVEAYTAGDNEVAAAYRDWTVTSTRPAVAGPHGARILQTFANDVAAEQYLEFASDGFEMPAGSVLAKESLAITDKATVRVGPLFIMTKVAAGEAEEFDDWVYSAVQPNGKPMGLQQSFCHDCHAAFADQDSLGYPLEEVRVGSGG